MSDTPELRLGVVGAGRMGETIVRGLVDSGLFVPDRIVCADPVETRLAGLVPLGVRVTDDNARAVDGADVILLSVKPQVLTRVLDEIAPDVPPGALVVSIAAGVRSATIEAHLEGIAVVRVMPNTPMLVGRGMSAVCPGRYATHTHVRLVQSLLAPLGEVVAVDESDMDAVTAVSGSGPAYLFAFAEAMIAAARAEGLDEPTSNTLVVQTLLGASTMLAGDPDPAKLRDQVTSPGGTTMAALEAFDRHGLADAVAAGVRAARRRSEELAGP